MKVGLCQVVLVLWLVTIGALTWLFVSGWTARGTDQRIAVMLAPSERELILSEMRMLLKAVHGVVTGMSVPEMDRKGMEDAARAAGMAMAADVRAGNIRSALHGVPWGVKDLFAVRGTPTTWGHQDFENQTFDYTSELVTRLENAGAVLLAKLSTGSIAQGSNWFRGSTRNPCPPGEYRAPRAKSGSSFCISSFISST